ncbi:MAG: DNA-binding protein [Robiginitomaculum sp.]|nr:MAG: DNA-binding protein [Robiginitomaculum sp.]
MGSFLDSPFRTPQEAAAFLRIHVRTLNNMRYRGAGPRYRKHGGKVVYHIEDLRAWSRDYEFGTGPSHRDKGQKRKSVFEKSSS